MTSPLPPSELVPILTLERAPVRTCAALQRQSETQQTCGVELLDPHDEFWQPRLAEIQKVTNTTLALAAQW